MSNKVGLLLPRSVLYPTMAFDMMAGLKSGLTDLGITDAEVKTENVGLGSEPRDIYTACEKLVFDGCTVVVGYVNPLAAEAIHPLFAGGGAIFVALDAGYQYTQWTGTLSNLFTVSLDGALCCRIMARTAVEDGCKRLAFTGSFYEAGYRSVHGFMTGLAAAGGEITFNHITQLKRADFTMEPLKNHLIELEPDGVLASFCGDMLQDYCTGAAADVVFAQHPVYGSPFMADEVWLAQCPYPGADYKAGTTWGSTLNNAANNHFKEVLAAKKQRINIWSMLAWEAARLVAVALMYEGESAVAAIENLTWDGVRGSSVINKTTHYVESPVYVGSVTKDDTTGKCALAMGEASPFTEQQRAMQREDILVFNSDSSTSWKNAYGCLES